MQDFVGKHIDRYRVTERLGMGGMAVVYKAYDTRLERDVAIKLIRTEAIPPEQYERLMKRFEREAKAQARFNHRHIMPVHDYGEVDAAPYLVMAYTPGDTLKTRAGKPIPYQQALRWLIPIADALAYAHDLGVIHRDVKPSNILFDEQEQPILTDFGIAKLLETDEATLTGTGMGVGTPEYMAPEQWRGQASPATDQYALGVVLYELLTGHKPYTADTPAAVAIMQATEPLQPPGNLVAGIPGSLEKLLYKALALRPEDRFEDMSAFKGALERELKSTLEGAKPVQSKQPSQPIMEKPAVQSISEAETIDSLEPTPPELLSPVLKPSPGMPVEKQSQKKEPFPSWMLWAGGILILVIGVILGSGFLGKKPAPGAKPTNAPTIQPETPLPGAAAASKTSLPTPTYTKTPIPSPTNTPGPTLGVGSTRVNPVDGSVMVYVPAGEFLMGSDDEDAWDEKPQHTVYLDAYWMDMHPVTNAQFAAFVSDTNYKTTAEKLGSSDVYIEGHWKGIKGAYWAAPGGPNTSVTDKLDHPVVLVSWDDADAYCQWAGGSLPTEAEWEKAARGTDGWRYPWGNQYPTCDLANFSGCKLNGTSPVGSFPDGASPYGALDMAGNVWEWVADWLDVDYYKTSPAVNPMGPSTSYYRARRGGAWFSEAWYIRTSYRDGSPPYFGYNYSGFRCAYPPAP